MEWMLVLQRMQKSLLLRTLCTISLRIFVKGWAYRDHLVEKQRAFSKAYQFGGKEILEGVILKREQRQQRQKRR